jgi:PKD repeat protein
MRLFIDGELAASNTDTTSAQSLEGYWRIGGDEIRSWPEEPSSDNFAGTIDEVAIYPSLLTSAQIQNHYLVGQGQVTNEAPTASFSLNNSGMSISVDGSGSADADGSVASYAWDFGDGSTGTGATATHTYAAAGTYTVTLTVTDDDDATGSTTQQVTVSESATLAEDAFARTVSSGFGTADQGGTWSAVTGGASGQVDGSTAVLSVPAGRSGTTTLSAVSTNSIDMTNTYTINENITGGGLYLGTIGRSTDNGDYRVRAKITSTGEVQLMGGRMVGGVNTVLGSRVTVPGLTYTPGTTLHMRVQVTGTGTTTIRGRIWADGDTEPSTWQVETTDTTAGLQTTGTVGTYAYLSGSATNPVTIDIDNLTATAI